jgi:XPG N-terminal domain
MGVSGVWGLLDSERGGCVSTVLSARDKQLGKVYAELDGAVVAIDLGLLVVKALTQPNQYESGLDPRGAVLKRVYENCVALLRAGVVPVGVTDGKPPEAKLERMSQRQGGTSYRCVRRGCWRRAVARPPPFSLRPCPSVFVLL